MVNSALQKQKAIILGSRSYIQKRSRMLIKEAFFLYKVSHSFKNIKAMKENIPYISRPIPSEDLP